MQCFRFIPAVLLLLHVSAFGAAPALLPVTGSGARPALLLELGSAPAALAAPIEGVRGTRGTAVGHDAASAVSEQSDELISSHPGFGRWDTSFRFSLDPVPAAGPYTLWARWRQGGEPAVCEQRFEVWAGAEAGRLERRGEVRLKPRGWDYAWLAAEPPIPFQGNEAVVEIRVSGAGHDAKIFDAFLLGPPPPPAALPVTPSQAQPALVLELGQEPPRRNLPLPAGAVVVIGRLTDHSGQGGLIEEKDEIQVLHPRFGEFGAGFRFALPAAPVPGHYRFYARYKSGGEVSQVAQRFSVKLGGDEASLAERGSLTLTNTSPWEYQWLAAEGTVPVFPGDRWVQIDNTGKADGAKVFDAFVLQLDTPSSAPMDAADAAARNRFLAGLKPIDHPVRRLYVLDDGSARGQALFAGLALPEVLRRLGDTAAVYRIGAEAEALARQLNLTGLPAAVLADGQYSLLGVLAQPGKPGEVARFLDDPRRYGGLPAIAAEPEPPAEALHDGIPPAWLVGGVQDGVAGLSIYGLDSEMVLRPHPGERYLSTELMGGVLRTWQRAESTAAGAVTIAKAEHDYQWAGGSGYGQVFLRATHPTRAWLQLDSGGAGDAVWLDGHEIALTRDRAALDLEPGWHRILLKRAMRLGPGQRFGFSARFTDNEGKPLDGMETRIADPAADPARNRVAARLRPLVYTEAPANLPHPGDSLKLRVDLRWHGLEQERELAAPIPAFPARLRVEIRDYRGLQFAVREREGVFPSVASLDFGKAPQSGYYAVYASLLGSDGRLIMAYPADGFSVVGGNAAQRQRQADKKLWNNYYYAFADGDRGFQQSGGYFDWLERSGIFKGYGSYPGAAADHGALWQQARRRGLDLFADTGGDSHWLNDEGKAGADYIAAVASHTRYFKANNEIDIRREAEWGKLRAPAHWVERARREHEAVHRVRADGHYVGGSLVRPGDLGNNAGYLDGLGPGRWFEQALQLGLDRYLDAWDVHAYPQRPPRFGGPIGNAEVEDERGVLAAFGRLGRSNGLPFWLGEAGAKAAHGASGRRWQAEQAAKMIAWVNSRPDYLGIAFCLGHEYDLGQGRLWDYSMGHKPGEAALYTAGALIDGLPYRRAETGDDRIQAAWFGPTLMAWHTEVGTGRWEVRLDPAKRWVVVDVVGRQEALPVPKDGRVGLELGESPVYLVPETDYRQLTRH